MLNIYKLFILITGVLSLFFYPVSVKADSIHCPTIAQIHASKARQSVWHLNAFVHGVRWGITQVAFTKDTPDLQTMPAHVVHHPGETEFYLVCPFDITNSITLNHTQISFTSPPQTGYTNCTIDQPEQRSMTCH